MKRCTILVMILLAVMANGQVKGPVMFFPVGKLPKGLSDFQCFGLNPVEGKPSKVEGWVMMDRENPNESTVTTKTLSLSHGRLRFTTAARNGISFRFEGKLTGSKEAEGLVTKLRSGRKTAQGRIRFSAGSGG